MPPNLTVLTNSPQAPPKPGTGKSLKPWSGVLDHASSTLRSRRPNPQTFPAQSAQKRTKEKLPTPPTVPHKPNKLNPLTTDWLPSVNPPGTVHSIPPEFVFSGPFVLGRTLPAVPRTSATALPLSCPPCTNLPNAKSAPPAALPITRTNHIHLSKIGFVPQTTSIHSSPVQLRTPKHNRMRPM